MPSVQVWRWVSERLTSRCAIVRCSLLLLGRMSRRQASSFCPYFARISCEAGIPTGPNLTALRPTALEKHHGTHKMTTGPDTSATTTTYTRANTYAATGPTPPQPLLPLPRVVCSLTSSCPYSLSCVVLVWAATQGETTPRVWCEYCSGYQYSKRISAMAALPTVLNIHCNVTTETELGPLAHTAQNKGLTLGTRYSPHPNVRKSAMLPNPLVFRRDWATWRTFLHSDARCIFAQHKLRIRRESVFEPPLPCLMGGA